MSKIRALYANEMIKISRRPSVIMVAAFTFIAALFFPFSLRIILSYDYTEDPVRSEREQIEASLNAAKNELKNANLTTLTENVTIEVDGKEKTVPMTLYSGNAVANRMSRKILYEDMLKDFDFDKYTVTENWLTAQTSLLYRTTIEGMINLDMTAFEERDEEWLKEYETYSAARESARRALMDHNYESYCKVLDTYGDAIDYHDYSTKSVRRLATSDPKGEFNFTEASYLLGYLEQIVFDQQTLESGLENSGTLPRILTEERKEILRNSIKILDYKFEKQNTYNEASMIAMMANYYTTVIARYALIVLLILIAGSSVSQELATGSIKSLIIAPVKRWKIFTAKLLSIITWMVFSSVILTLFSLLGTGLAFGFGKLPPYLYVSGGNVVEMPFLVAKILIDFLLNIPAFFYALVAFMASCFTKNSGVSVGIPAGLFLFHEVPTYLQGSDMPQRFLDFTPIANMEFAEKLFPYYKLMLATEDMDFDIFGSHGFTNTLWSMVLYLVILTGTVLLIAYDEFTKKDIA